MWPTRSWFEEPVGGELRRLHEELDRALSGGVAGRVSREYPPVRVHRADDGDTVILTAELPGVSSDSLDVSVLDDTVTLTGAKPASDAFLTEDEREHTRCLRRECGQGDFSRSLRLPFRIDAEGVNASLKHGVLVLRLPKAEEEKARRIAVTA